MAFFLSLESTIFMRVSLSHIPHLEVDIVAIAAYLSTGDAVAETTLRLATNP